MNAEEARTTKDGKGNGTVAGRTHIAEVVVESIAGVATKEAPGVHAMGGGVSRAMGAVRDRLPSSGEDNTRGVHAEVGEKQAAIDVGFVVEYGTAITDTARQVRSNVSRAVGKMTGLEVVEVNVDVLDIHVPGDSEDSEDGEGDGGADGAQRSARGRSEDSGTALAGRTRVE
ncbi:Asp23/Gls24 family envelope stress response protein [Streptomyces sp. NPDC005438]|uniref:Asp23/Gls24 family envelope stress response protein n=1 Tax=Streptomyces sp. NPDC005438 TaxID=3156880 RepID=UPI0033AB3172